SSVQVVFDELPARMAQALLQQIAQQVEHGLVQTEVQTLALLGQQLQLQGPIRAATAGDAVGEDALLAERKDGLRRVHPGLLKGALAKALAHRGRRAQCAVAAVCAYLLPQYPE